MQYISTRDANRRVSASQAIVAGISPDGGLFLPEEIPQVTPEELSALCAADYPHRAANILARFLTDFTESELLSYAEKAYAREKFPPREVAPVVSIGDNGHVLELFHGPTSAFKDFALQMLPHLLTASLRKNGETRTVIILVATSGDTGKAALEGFADVPGTKICVFYPHGGTSSMQRLQMTTQRGENVMVSAVRGNFDDAQTGVKALFTDEAYLAELAARGYLLSSANSINWGRLAPQIAYYYSAYCDLAGAGKIRMGEKINVCVPTGNFGNILAAWYAKHSGLPIARLICASNRNNVLSDFLSTGVYDKNRAFHLTTSPSMDILVSSNLERLLSLTLEDEAQLKSLMAALKTEGRYEISAQARRKLQAEFACGWADDEAVAAEIAETFARDGYLPDTHTAVGLRVWREYRRRTDDETPTVLAATASPFKFCPAILGALGKPVPEGDFERLSALSRETGLPVPPRLAELQGLPERFAGVVDPRAMRGVVDAML